MIIIISGIIKLRNMSINHNDLHFNNILYVEKPTKYWVYNENYKEIVLNSDVQILLYDYDRAYYNNHNHNNPILNGLGCNSFVDKHDIFIFIQQILGIIIIIKDKSEYTNLYKILIFIYNTIVPANKQQELYNNMLEINSSNIVHSSTLSAKKNGQYHCNGYDINLIDSFNWLYNVFLKLPTIIHKLSNEPNPLNIRRISQYSYQDILITILNKY
jgi:hypothetical protein